MTEDKKWPFPYSQDEWQKAESPCYGARFVMWVAERPFVIDGFEFRDVNSFAVGVGPYLLKLRIGMLSVLGYASLKRLLTDGYLRSLNEWPRVTPGNVIRMDFSDDFTGSVRMIAREL